ncbi:MAG: hypothetical protein ABI995_04885, partial [Acidobacteriota bacterium]
TATMKKPAKLLEQAGKSGSAAKPAMEVSAGVPRAEKNVPRAEKNNVPPPPPVKRAVPVRREQARALPQPTLSMAPLNPVSPPRPPADLSTVATGMARDRVLELGTPSARITMYEDGHLTEIFQYSSAQPGGTVQLRDGAVASVVVRP